ncbi:MAG: hypothetical protein KA715_08690 [Xanthomonadaceae bacterium]|nr:hypothetical protein [Xanthomonadaceae bacterium]
MRLIFALILGVFYSQAFAQTSAHSLHDLENYELEAINEELTRLGWEFHPSPEGNTIKDFAIKSLDVFEARDPYPVSLNKVHIITQPWVIEREVLVTQGEKWDSEYAYETERILRRWLPLAWVRVVPARIKSNNEVHVLIITQDLWSLRPEMDISFVGSRLEVFDFGLIESNLFGQAMQVGPTFHLDLGTIAFGGLFRNYRLGHTDYGLRSSAKAVLNRYSGVREGQFITATFNRPLVRLDDKWGGDFTITSNQDIYRAFSSGTLATVSIPETSESPSLTYSRQVFELNASVTRSYGRQWKSNWTGGYGYFYRNYPLIQTGLTQTTQDLFISRYLPVSESAGYFYLKWEGYQASYQRRMNYDTYAITEDFREGLSANVSLSGAARTLGGTSEYLLPSIGVGQNWFFGEAILAASTQASFRYQPGVDSRTPFVNRNTSTAIKYFSPSFKHLRWVASGRVATHIFDRYRTQEFLGGDTTLRGFPSGWLRGSQVITLSQELRTEPVKWLSTYFGAVVFQDWGDAFDHFGNMRLRPTAGAGIRFGFPQFQREVVRFDIGFPLHALDADLGPTAVFQFNQAI